MANKSNQRPNRKSPRWKNWDYANEGSYFITTVTKNRRPFFGYIEFGEMILNSAGQIAYSCWEELPDHFQNIELGEFIVMPDHFHGIINIIERDKNIIIDRADPPQIQNITDRACPVPTVPTVPTGPTGPTGPANPAQKRFRNQGKNTLSSMVGSFKSAVTRLARPDYKKFAWQGRFHDHVIRNAGEYERISRYIKNNPQNWGKKYVNDIIK